MTKARDLANGGFGLVLVKPSSVVNGTDNGKGTVSFSAVGSVSLNNVFNATYRHYKINFSATNSASCTINIRFRASNADNSTASSYGVQYMFGTGTGSVQTANESGAQAIIGSIASSTQSGNASIEIFNPFNAVNTGFMSNNQESNGAAVVRMGYHNQAVSYDGFTITSSTGNMTGTVSVYGFNN